jgi:hypothetical protein
MEEDQRAVVVSSTTAGDRPSPALPRPAQCTLFTDETWAKLDDARESIASSSSTTGKIEFSEEYRRFLDEYVIGTDNSAHGAFSLLADRPCLSIDLA